MSEAIPFKPKLRWVNWSITIQQSNDWDLRFQIHDLDDPETPEQARRIAATLQRMIDHLQDFADGKCSAN